MVGKLSKCSRIMLGTVQFGLDYGISNREGMVSYGEALEMVDFALNRGVNSFDTAPGYGESEKTLGKIFKELGISEEDIFISDKVSPVPAGLSKSEVREFIRNSVYRSLSKLGVGFIDVCLFHREGDSVYMEELLELRDEGMIGEAGVSVYMPVAALGAVSDGLAGAIQLPASVLDRRFLRAGVFERARERGVSVFVRSIYLQGLILMDGKDVPESLAEARPAVKVFTRLAEEAGAERSEFALRYALSLPGVAAVLVGACGKEQFENNMYFSGKGALPPDLFHKADEVLPELSEKVLLPYNWSG